MNIEGYDNIQRHRIVKKTFVPINGLSKMK